MTLIECRDITIGYEKDGLIKNLSFSVSEGDYLCVVGENGSGKTTFVKTILGLVEPVVGKVKLNASGIGYLPQQNTIDHSFPSSVMEVVLSGLLKKKKTLLYREEEKERAREILSYLGLKSEKKYFKELSGGERQKVLLARALMATSDILLLDEPVTSLDTKSASDLYNALTLLNRGGTAVIMVTHDIHPLINSARTVLNFSQNGSYFFGSKDDYLLTEDGRKFLKEAGHAD